MRGLFYRIGFNTFIQAIGKIVSTILAFISIGLLTRYLGQEGYGNFALVFAYLSFFGILADLGLQLTMVRELARKAAQPREIYGTYFWLKFFLVILSICFAIIFLLFLPYSQFLKTGIIIAAIGVGLGFLNNYGTVIFQANLRLDLVTLVDVGSRTVSTLLIMLFVFTGRGFYSILNTVLMGNLIGALLIAFLVPRFVGFNLIFKANLAKKLILQGIPVALVSFLASLYFKIDTLILSLSRGTTEVGIYALAYRIIENLMVFWGFYMATTYPLLSSFLGKGKNIEASRLWRNSLLIAIGSSAVVISIGYILSPLVIRILGGEMFTGSIAPLRILLFSIPFFFINNLFYHFFLAKNNVRIPIISISLSLLVNLLLNLILIPRFGYLAAAFNTLVTVALSALIYYLLIPPSLSLANSKNE